MQFPKDLIENVSPGLEPFVAEFLVDRNKDFNQLNQLIRSSDHEAARKIAHNWKGFCGPYGFAGLGLLAAELEKALLEKNHGLCETVLEQIRIYLANKKIQPPASEVP